MTNRTVAWWLAPWLLVACSDAEPRGDAGDASAEVGGGLDGPSLDAVSPGDVPATDGPASCRSDDDCGAAGRVCDRRRRQCVECVTRADCRAGQACVSSRCVAATPCASSRTCPGLVCDMDVGFCAECVASGDCAAGWQCEAGSCLAPAPRCSGDRQCSEFGLVCDLAGGVCVDCVRDVDCPSGTTCAGARCRPARDGGAEGGVPDAPMPDAPMPDVAMPDAPMPDATPPDAAMPEAAVDAPTPDASADVPARCTPGTAECASATVRRVCTGDGSGYFTDPCPVPASAASATCDRGACGFTCVAGSGNCDGDPVNGCETALGSSAMHCGACGNACPAGQRCDAGRCVAGVVCHPYLTACGASCFDLQNNPNNCGVCGRVCAAGQVCYRGACVSGCPVGLQALSGRCLENISSGGVPARGDALNCGGAGSVCAPAEVCSLSRCAPACAVGLTQCGRDCVNPLINPRHCGTCGTACGPTEACIAGRCVTPTAAQCASDPYRSVCGASCFDLQNDVNNCGVCGRVCAAGQVCYRGACVSGCPIGLQALSGRCLENISSAGVPARGDALNCGGAGSACAPAEVCSQSRCAPMCAEGLTQCGRDCVNRLINPRHCGACGTSCSPGEACIAGRCILPSAAQCGSDPYRSVCGASCFDLQNDVNNCGVCGRVCAAGQVCYRGACVSGCPIGLQALSGRCLENISSAGVPARGDALNCGGAGSACAPAEVCSLSRCAPACAVGLTQCGRDCVNPLINPRHCGACGTGCSPMEACIAGRCVTPSAAQCASDPYRSVCGASCFDLQNDVNNCGACGRVCAAGQACYRGACVSGCPIGLQALGGRCLENISSGGVPARGDALNCGGVGSACAPAEVCSQSRCAPVCGEGLTQCGRDCVNPLVNPRHCGACGTACSPVEACIAGRCVVPTAAQCASDPYRSVCGASCFDLQNDVNNCGACGRVCAAGQACYRGACVSGCPAGLQLTSGRCLEDISSGGAPARGDSLNCGGVGSGCAPAEVCSLSRCAPACVAGLTQCGRDCVNPLINPRHCGTCGTGCVSGQACISGRCRP